MLIVGERVTLVACFSIQCEAWDANAGEDDKPSPRLLAQALCWLWGYPDFRPFGTADDGRASKLELKSRLLSLRLEC